MKIQLESKNSNDGVPFWVMLAYGLLNWFLSGYVYARVHNLNFWK